MRQTGTYQKIAGIKYFTPYPLPPSNPEILIDSRMMKLYGEASYALGELNNISKKVPDKERFIKSYIIKEGLLSSEIEGINTTLIDIFTCNLEYKKIKEDTQLVLNYIKALEHAIDLVQNKNLPICSRVVLETHKELMTINNSGKASPGEYRKQGVKVGNHIPPCANQVHVLMSDLEKYINNENDTLPILIKAGLMHVQFETIHPFLDGNGRIGRLLIVLMLVANGVLEYPILYPSYFFKKYRYEYYRKLDGVRVGGDFEGWIQFYLEAIRDSCYEAIRRSEYITTYETYVSALIKHDPRLKRVRDIANISLGNIFKMPIFNINQLSKINNKSYDATRHIVKHFVNIGLLSHSKTKRNKTYYFTPYLDLLEKDLVSINNPSFYKFK